jgi:hypothetical protein
MSFFPKWLIIGLLFGQNGHYFVNVDINGYVGWVNFRVCVPTGKVCGLFIIGPFTYIFKIPFFHLFGSKICMSFEIDIKSVNFSK